MYRSSIARMLAPCVLGLLLLGAAAGVASAGKGDGGPAERLFYAAGEPDRVAWISAEMATSEDGSIDWQAVPENARISYQELRNWQPTVIDRAEDGSPVYDPWESHAVPGFGAYWGPSYYHGIEPAPSDSLDQLIANARYVVQGVVTAREQGFFLDEPMTLLTLGITRLAPPKANDELAAPFRTPVTETLYVAYPSARFTIGGHGFAKGDPAYPPLPEIGDSILFFAFTVALDVDRLIFRPEADKVLVQPAGGTIDPEHYRHTWERRGRTVPETLEEVAAMVARDRAFETIAGKGGAS